MAEIIKSTLPVLTGGEEYKVTSPFGWRADPVTGLGNGQHKGIDLTLWKGWSALSAIGAAWDGVVTDVRDGVDGFDTVRSAGNRVTIDHGDGVVTTKDALMLMQCLNDDLILSDDEFKRADLNGNGVLEAAEALRILQYINGKVTTLKM